MKQVVTFRRPVEKNGRHYCPFCNTQLEQENQTLEDEYSIMPPNEYYECPSCEYYWVDE